LREPLTNFERLPSACQNADSVPRAHDGGPYGTEAPRGEFQLLGPGASLIPPELAERVLAGEVRFAIINVWRNIADAPVAVYPLAMCDAQTVDPADLVIFEIHYGDRVGENYFARAAPRHRWYFYPALTRDEVILIKQWDSAGPLARSKGEHADASSPDRPCTFSFHSAFRDPEAAIEVRCMVIYA
jgi:hypothetical protein